MFKKILWCSDDSEDSKKAFEMAEFLANKYNSDLIGLTIFPFRVDQFNKNKNIKSDVQSEIDELYDWIEKKFIAVKKKDFDKISKSLKKKGIDFNGIVKVGIPAKGILDISKDEDVNLIAMGTGGSVKKSLLGGTAIKVLRNAKIPIVITKKSNQIRKFKRIVVPIDPVHGLTKAFKYATELSKKFNSDIDLLNIIEFGDYRLPQEAIQTIKTNLHREIREICGKSVFKGSTPFEENVKIHVEKDKNAWRGIVKFAKKNNSDLICMMTYGGIKFKEEFIGSMTQKVIQEAPCPVLTMNP